MKKVEHFIDNQGAKFLTESLEFRRIKHLEIKYHWIRQLVAAKQVFCSYVNTKFQLAELMTKPLNRVDYERLPNLILE